VKKREQVIISMFLSTSLVCSGCGLISSSDFEAFKNNQEDEINSFQVASLNEATLKDKNDEQFTIIKNDNGTTTAKYDDGREVSFKVDDNGNMVYINGDKSLMENIYESYLSYLGVNSGSMVADNNGSYSNNSGNNYSGHSHFVPFINGFGAGYLSSSLSSSSDRAFSPSSKPSPSTVKSGFTGGGGRSSAVS
jgi:hypothetical protein